MYTPNQNTPESRYPNPITSVSSGLQRNAGGPDTLGQAEDWPDSLREQAEDRKGGFLLKEWTMEQRQEYGDIQVYILGAEWDTGSRCNKDAAAHTPTLPAFEKVLPGSEQ